MDKEKVLIVCPGRGTYTKESLGYLKPFQSEPFLKLIDGKRKELGEPKISEIDGASRFDNVFYTKGEHASPLIYACSLADFLTLDQDRYEVISIAGNSMGWYTALSLTEALNKEEAFSLIQTMGSMMKEDLIGEQIIYPIMDESWNVDRDKRQRALDIIERVNERSTCNAYVSIYLGGYLVIGCNSRGGQSLIRELPREEPYPFRLINHGAFHTPLLTDISQKALTLFPQGIFQAPKIPLIDGRGKIWMPYSTDPEELRQYTLGEQVVESYNFSRSIEVGLKEMAPDRVILLGPGNNLGGVLGQIMIAINWRGLSSKEQFVRAQTKDAYLISMGLPPPNNK